MMTIADFWANKWLLDAKCMSSPLCLHKSIFKTFCVGFSTHWNLHSEIFWNSSETVSGSCGRWFSFCRMKSWKIHLWKHLLHKFPRFCPFKTFCSTFAFIHSSEWQKCTVNFHYINSTYRETPLRVPYKIYEYL